MDSLADKQFAWDWQFSWGWGRTDSERRGAKAWKRVGCLWWREGMWVLEGDEVGLSFTFMVADIQGMTGLFSKLVHIFCF